MPRATGLKRIDALAKNAPGNVESALARRARRASTPANSPSARAALAPYLDAPTKRIALLMAALERAEAQRRRPRPRMDGARAARRARSGMDRRRLCLRSLAAGVAGDRPARRLRMARAAHRHDQRRAGDRAGTCHWSSRPSPRPTPQCTSITTATRRLPANGPAAAVAPRAWQPAQPKAEPVIPLVHAPDDPGPEAEIVEETEAEPDAKPSGWRKIFE